MARRLSFRGLDYPKRGKFFSHRFQRLLAKVCAAQQIGCDGCYLLVIVSQIEDARRYTSPPTFYNDQLMHYLGCTQKQLLAIRRRCIEAGWLHYEKGTNRRAGLYWVVVPECYSDLDDSPLGEETDVDKHQGPKGNLNGNRTAIERSTERQSNGLPSLPVPDPFPTPTKEAVAAAEKRLISNGLAKPRETVDEALSNGLPLSEIHSAIDYFESRPGAWGPGALRKRLISPSAPALASDQGWPPPSPKERQIRESVEMADELEERREKARAHRDDRDRLKQLEFEFGPAVDALSTDEQLELLGDHPFLAKLLRQQGPHSAAIRPQLLKAFAAQSGSN